MLISRQRCWLHAEKRKPVQLLTLLLHLCTMQQNWVMKCLCYVMFCLAVERPMTLCCNCIGLCFSTTTRRAFLCLHTQLSCAAATAACSASTLCSGASAATALASGKNREPDWQVAARTCSNMAPKAHMSWAVPQTAPLMPLCIFTISGGAYGTV